MADVDEPADEAFDALDEALTETFPASDPIAVSTPDARDRRGSVNRRAPADLRNP